MKARRFARGALLALLLFIITPMTAQQQQSQAEYPTVAALEMATLPVRDRVDLARRLRGVTEIPAPPAAPPDYEIGDRRTFWVSNLAADFAFQIEAVLRVTGEHLYLWVEDGAQVSDRELQTLAAAFDRDIYQQVRALWGSENKPGIDGDPHVYGLFTRGIGGGTAAYFTSEHTYPSVVVPTSNEHEMFIFNLDTIGGQVAGLASITGHEFQHMIRHHVDENEDTWMDEGSSTFTERYLGYDTPLNVTLSFMQTPNTQLNAWSEQGPRAPHYGGAFLFITYFYERYGLEALQRLSADPANGLMSVDHILRQMGETDVNTFFADWVLANYLLDTSIEDGRYGYTLLWDGLPGPLARAQVLGYPYRTTTSVSQYAADYYVLSGLDGLSSLEVSIAAPSAVPLVPTQAASGRWMWYSNRGDQSDTRLTRAFDLRAVEHATLSYKLWHHLERYWDYGYVMVSADDGATWTPLETPHTTWENPQNSAYGPGYTGESGGWLQEEISLDTYAGQEILVRFEMITDDAVNQPGMVIDDVRLEAVGYASDFESGDGGWSAEGWVRIDNALPQQAWVQVAQQHGRETTITRWLVDATGGASWSLPLVEGVDQIILSVSPFAPVTTVAMPYALSISALQAQSASR